MRGVASASTRSTCLPRAHGSHRSTSVCAARVRPRTMPMPCPAAAVARCTGGPRDGSNASGRRPSLAALWAEHIHTNTSLLWLRIAPSAACTAGTVLTSLRLLLAEPNADDPLMDDIAAQLRTDPHGFRRAAAEHTRLHARPAAVGAAGSAPEGIEAARPADAAEQSPAPPLAAAASASIARPAGSDAAGVPGERNAKRLRSDELQAASAAAPASDLAAADEPS